MLFKNGFPLNFSDTNVGKALNNFFQSSQRVAATVSRKPIYLNIPYTGSHSFNIRNRISKLISEFYPQVSFKIVFTTQNNIGSFFKIKDKIPDDLRSCVIYEYVCECRSASYIGKCQRHFKTRMNEHLGRSARTGSLMSKPPYSAIREHCHNNEHQISTKNFKILDSCADPFELNIMEALYQHIRKPTLGRVSLELACI